MSRGGSVRSPGRTTTGPHGPLKTITAGCPLCQDQVRPDPILNIVLRASEEFFGAWAQGVRDKRADQPLLHMAGARRERTDAGHTPMVVLPVHLATTTPSRPAKTRNLRQPLSTQLAQCVMLQRFRSRSDRGAGPLPGGRPPYGYPLVDAGPHPNAAHARWGRRPQRLEPDPTTARHVRWIFAQRRAGHSASRIATISMPGACRARQARTLVGIGTARARSGRCGRWPRSWPIRATPGGRSGTGSSPTTTPSAAGSERPNGGTSPRIG
jgi:hypothetical protein